MALTREEEKKAVDLAWRVGRLRYKFKPIQGRMADDWERGKANTRKHVLHISRQIGKSTFLFILAVEKCLQKANARVAFVAPVERRLEDYIATVALNVLHDAPVDLEPTYLGHKNIYNFKNGSQIIFAGSNNQSYNALRGSKFDYFFVDEAAFVDNLGELVDEVALPTLFHNKGYLILSSTSPVTPDHPFKRYCEEAAIDGAYSKYTILDDETLEKEEVDKLIKNMGGIDSSRCRRELFCEFTVDEERALTPAWDERFIREEVKDEYFPFYHLYESMDLGFKRDFTCVVFGYYDYRQRRVVIEDEIVIKGPKLTSKSLAEMIKAKEKSLWHDPDPGKPLPVIYKRVSDNDDLIFLNTMSVEQNLHFTPTSKDSLHNMIDRLNGMLREDRTSVHPRCKYIIQCLRTGIWDKERRKLDRSEVLGHYDGTMALAYWLENLDVWSNPIPSNFKRDPMSRVFHEDKIKGGGDLEDLKRLFKDHQKEIL